MQKLVCCSEVHAETGSVVLRRKGKCGRKRKTTPKDEPILPRNKKKKPRKSSFELQKDLAYSGVHVSSATVRHRLIEAGRKAKYPTKKQLLTQKRMKKVWHR